MAILGFGPGFGRYFFGIIFAGIPVRGNKAPGQGAQGIAGYQRHEWWQTARAPLTRLRAPGSTRLAGRPL